MHFIIACWDLQKPVAIIGQGFETVLHHVHALFQQLLSYSTAHLLRLFFTSQCSSVAVSVERFIQGHLLTDLSNLELPCWS